MDDIEEKEDGIRNVIKSVTRDKYEPIHLAVKEGDINSVKKILNEGIDIDLRTKHGSTSLKLAISYSNFEMIRFLLENNANPNLKDRFGFAPLHFAASNGDLPFAKLLVIHGAKLNLPDDKQVLYPIHYAAGESLELIQYLIAHGAETKTVVKGWTLMHSAADGGKNDIVKYLFDELGLDINATTDFGETPLELAEREGHKSTIKLIKKLVAKSRKT